MRQVHCDGCGFTEPDDLAKSKQRIQRGVSLSIVKDMRAPGPEGTEKHEADLCPNCLGMLLHTYFKIPAKGKLDVPAFVGPRVVVERLLSLEK
ncbi:MAG: hypothetical protein ABWY25_07705 [Paenisporosarcina sp.]